MYYELYIDVFFLVNFMMNYLVLSISKKILKCPGTHGSICLGALTGTVLTCGFMIIPVTYSVVKFIVFHGGISILMIKTGLRVNWGRSFIRAYAVVYISACLIGGVFSSFKQYIREASIFFVLAFVSYFVALGIWDYISYMGRCKKISCEVLLVQGERQLRANAIIDTGNRLRDAVTGKPVSIISKKIADFLWQEIPCKGLRYIPFHTIGKKDGVLPSLLLDEMRLYVDGEIKITKVLVAIDDETIGTGEYDVILNPDLR